MIKLALVSTKGGVGKTTLALNLAVSVRRTTGLRVCILDGDMRSGDVALLLNLAPVRTIADLVHEEPPWTAELLAEYLTHHGPSGVDVLAGPVKPEWAEAVKASHLASVLALLRQMYDYVFVDTTPQVGDLELTLLDGSSTILMVTAMDVPSIKNVRQGLDLLAELNYPAEKIKVVLNRSHSRAGGIDVRDVELGLHRAIASHIPAGGQEITESGNKGDPFMLHDRSSEVATSVQRLAESLLDAAPPGRPGLLNRFAGIFGAALTPGARTPARR
jgi:pilus assembly protein CpaE